MNHWMGLDIGTIQLKAAGLVPQKKVEALKKTCFSFPFFIPQFLHEGFWQEYRCILFSPIRHRGEIFSTVETLLGSLQNVLSPEKIFVVLTGSAGKTLSQTLGFPFVNDFQAIGEGMGLVYPGVRTVFEMGGGSSKYIRFEPCDGRLRIVDYEVNGECAAGTGLFFDQQVERIEVSLEEVGELVRQAKRCASIAGRCSVFAKTDMIHAQQRGFTSPEILKGLCEAVVRNFKGTVVKGKAIESQVAFIGGMSANPGIVDAFRTVFGFQDGTFLVPEIGLWIGAIGAAYFGLRQFLSDTKMSFSATSIKPCIQTKSARPHEYPYTRPLSLAKAVLLRDRVVPFQFSSEKPVEAFLGLDIGSVSTNLALITFEGELIDGIYEMTRGKPIEVVKACLREMEEKVGSRVQIIGVGTTGSGRELIGAFVGADVIKDEITAHTRGALHIARHFLNKDVDTIFEIGGQDSKFISIRNGAVVDFALNEACSAGTGSFLEEQGHQLGVSIRDEFARLALQAERPLKLGERCTVFMGKEIAYYLQQGVPKSDILAGLAYSVVQNYLSKVVKKRPLGKTIFFQGGTAYNDAVVAAFATLLDREIVVPPHNGIIGAIGAGLLARDKVITMHSKTRFRGWNMDTIQFQRREFTCQACSNRCEIEEFSIGEEKTYWGDKCSSRYRKPSKTNRKSVIPNLIQFRENLINEIRNCSPPSKKIHGKVGFPFALFFHDRFPFWKAYWETLGFEIVDSSLTTRELIASGIEMAVAEPCFPIQVAHGHFYSLLKLYPDVEYIFFPNTVNEEDPLQSVASFLCPWVQTLPLVAKQAKALKPFVDRFLYPRVHFREEMEKVESQLYQEIHNLGIFRFLHKKAVEAGFHAQNAFREKIKEMGRKIFPMISNSSISFIVLLGRPYNLYDPGLNLSIPQKLIDLYGQNVIPLDFLPIENMEIRNIHDHMFWNYGRRILQAARFVRDYPNMHLIYISNFKCGPDSYIRHYVEEVSGKPFLFLQLDAHSNDAGVMTRIEAFLESRKML